MKEIDNVDGLAEYLGTTPAGVYSMRHRGEGPPSIKIGGRIRFRKDAVDEWLDSQIEAPRNVSA